MIGCSLQPIVIQHFYSSLIIATHEFFILLIVAKQWIGLYLDEFFVSE
jgi:hypothetical protein